MPYIDYAQIKQRIPLDTVVDMLELRVRGRSIRCPNGSAHAHGDTHPSAYISSTRLTWHCHGCGAGGSVIDLFATARNIPRHQAALLLDHDSDIEHRSRIASAPRPSTLPLAPAPSHPLTPPTLAPVLAAALAALTYGSQGHRYLNRRGIPLAVARNTTIGFAPRKSWPHIRGAAQPRIVAPLTWSDGTLTTLYGRSTVACHKALRHDLLPGVKGLFNVAALAASTVILTEGVFDALSVLAAGWPAAALCGLSIRDEWWPLIGARRIILALDADGPGQQQAAALLEVAQHHGKQVQILPFHALHPHKDLNDYWIAHRALPTPLRLAFQPTHESTKPNHDPRAKPAKKAA